jgi:hypothetical protein
MLVKYIEDLAAKGHQWQSLRDKTALQASCRKSLSKFLKLECPKNDRFEQQWRHRGKSRVDQLARSRQHLKTKP